MKQRSATCPSPIDIYILMLIPTISLAAVGFAHFSVNVNVVRAAYYLMLLAGAAIFISVLTQSRIGSAATQAPPRIHKLLMLYTVPIVSITSIMALATPIVISIPYIDNHIVSWGYAGLPMTAALSAACIFLIYFERTSRPFYLLLALFSLCSVALFKNIGILYVMITVVAALAAKFVSAQTEMAPGERIGDSKLRGRFITMMALIGCAALIGSLILYSYEGHVIQILGKRLALNIPDFAILVDLLVHSILKNASYNLSFIIIGLAIVSNCCVEWEQEEQYGRAFLSLLSMMALALWFASLTTEYALSRAVPARDTGGTRHLMTPVIISIILSVKSLVAFRNSGVKAD